MSDLVYCAHCKGEGKRPLGTVMQFVLDSCRELERRGRPTSQVRWYFAFGMLCGAIAGVIAYRVIALRLGWLW